MGVRTIFPKGGRIFWKFYDLYGCIFEILKKHFSLYEHVMNFVLYVKWARIGLFPLQAPKFWQTYYVYIIIKVLIKSTAYRSALNMKKQ